MTRGRNIIGTRSIWRPNGKGAENDGRSDIYSPNDALPEVLQDDRLFKPKRIRVEETANRSDPPRTRE